MKRDLVDLSPQGAAHLRAAAELGDGGPAPARLADGAAFFGSLQTRAENAELGGEAPLVAWELARACPDLRGEPARAMTLLVLGTFVALRDGSTYLPLEKTALAEHLRSLEPGETEMRFVAALAEALREAQLPEALAPIVGAPGARKPLVLANGRLQHERLWHAEERLVGAVLARRALALDWPARDAAVVTSHKAALAEVIAHPTRAGASPVVLTARQEAAVARAVASPFTVIAGGPGTGKTSVIVAMLRTLARCGVAMTDVALAAPTGKAAHRMSASVARSLGSLAAPSDADRRVTAAPPTATTLHRFLGYSPSQGRFGHHQNNRLAQRFVVVDEASMIDLFLMESLLRALRDDARLVLLGDTDQLPSVAAGRVLRDLGDEDVTRLVENHRMDPRDPSGRAILTIADHINAGRAQALERPTGQGDLFGSAGVETRAGPGALIFEGVELFEPMSADERAATWREWWRRRIVPSRARATIAGEVLTVPDGDDVLRAALAHYENARVLCVTKGAGLPTGAEAVNAFFHQLALEDALARGAVRGAPSLLPGEPVLLVENDHERGLFNGDQGLIARVGGEELAVIFAQGEGLLVLALEALRPRLRLSYATTVHKSQGSEMEYVALALPDVDHPLVTRELLYTAVTRAKKSVAIVGPRAVFLAGVSRAVRRSSLIAEKLAARSGT